MEIIRTSSAHKDFQNLVARLDEDLAARDGDEHEFYHQFNSIAHLKHCIVLYKDKTPIGCGAFKVFDEYSVEIKRMYVPPSHRGQGIATQILSALEQWATECGYHCSVLETGIRQPEAIALYQKNGYSRIPNYGQYVGIANSVCFEKTLVG